MADQDKERDLALLSALPEAQFRVFYQPIIDLATNETNAYEALLRWQHPNHGTLEASSFIKDIERLGMMQDVGRWLINRVCSDMAEWLGTDYRRRIAVNVSASELLAPGFLDDFKSALLAHHVDVGSIELEVSENIPLQSDAARAVDQLNLLKQFGFSICFDDFGTGYSSIKQLRDFQGHRLKIDKCFIDGIETSERDRLIVRTLIDLAWGLGLKTVAEGIENSMQQKICKDFGCSEGQGFYIGMPLPLEVQWR